jgi:hypothetical protein
MNRLCLVLMERRLVQRRVLYDRKVALQLVPRMQVPHLRRLNLHSSKPHPQRPRHPHRLHLTATFPGNMFSNLPVCLAAQNKKPYKPWRCSEATSNMLQVFSSVSACGNIRTCSVLLHGACLPLPTTYLTWFLPFEEMWIIQMSL